MGAPPSGGSVQERSGRPPDPDATDRIGSPGTVGAGVGTAVGIGVGVGVGVSGGEGGGVGVGVGTGVEVGAGTEG